MPVLSTESCLASNIACLGERNAELAERLAAVAPPPGLEFTASAEGVPAASLNGRQLCSRHRPLEEAARQTESIDLVEHAAVVVLGFGMGYHVQRLAERSKKATLIIVFEPDVALLRAVLDRVDHSAWMKDALLLFITDESDRGLLARKLDGAESILAQGVHFHEHLPSRARLGERASKFSAQFTDYISNARTTLMTTLMRSVDTTRNLMLNLDHYAAGSGILELHKIAAAQPAVVVSAGPSLQKNMHLLKQPHVRERCVIIAVQTTLKPLLAAGIKPHFVTALDYHEISKRFYEDLTPLDVQGVTLVADPKAHPVILDAFPGPIRCCANGFLDKLLGPQKTDKGDLPAGATVAHLAVYLARYMGCQTIAMIGQDLGFTDGLYYAPAPGVAIHDVWAPELNPFNTIEMMEWQRIARHRTHLRKLTDVHGKSIYTDAQMHAYLQQFERDFAQYKREGVTIIDATEGGVAKQHTTVLPLADFIKQHVLPAAPIPELPVPAPHLDERRLVQTRRRLAEVRADVHRLRELSLQTASLLAEMIEHQNDLALMSRHFERIDRNRKEVEQRFDAFELLNQLNQLGVFNRMKADRRLHMQPNLTPLAKQRCQLERDRTNVIWIADAAKEMLEQLEHSDRLLTQQSNSRGARQPHQASPKSSSSSATSAETSVINPHRAAIAALIAIDPDRNGLGVPRSLSESFNNRPVLQVTLERLGRSKEIDSIILLAPRTFDVEKIIDRSRIKRPVEIDWLDCSPFGRETAAIAAARLWAASSWRGGIAGIGAYDELLCPKAMHEAMQRRGLSAALIVGPDWPLVQVTEPGGCDDVIRRHREHAEQHRLVITQSPPGLCGCLASAALMQELSAGNRLCTIGGLLTYQPHAPQSDPIAREMTVQIDHTVRRSLVRATFDSPRQRHMLMQFEATNENAPAADFIAKLETLAAEIADIGPQQLMLEICTERSSHGRFRRHLRSANPISRPPLTLELAQRIFDELNRCELHDLALTLDGAGDPLLHPQFDQIISMAKAAGVRGVNVRTELLADRATLDRLLACDVDVVSIDLNADRAATYLAMMGVDRFKDVLLNIEYLLQHRRRLTDQPGTAAFALPWVVPHLQRCAETYEDIDSFYDRWQHMLGCAVIEGLPPCDAGDSLAAARTPQQVIERDQRARMMILCDGTIPIDHWDWTCQSPLGNIADRSLLEIWRSLLHARGMGAAKRVPS